MRRSLRVAWALGLLAVAATVALIALAVRGAMAVSCEVCIAYGGRTVCRSASGSSREEATRTATENACAFLAAGMTETIRCTATPPARVTCVGEPTAPR